MPRSKPIAEGVLERLWLLLVENYRGAANIGTRRKVLSRLFEDEKIDFSSRQLRQALDQLNATRRIVCSTSRGTFVPTTDEEFEQGYRYRHHMATALLEGCRLMREGWEAEKLERAAVQGDARACGTQGALPGMLPEQLAKS
jgi:hypothetical protein